VSARSLERVRVAALRVLAPLRSEYSAEMLGSAVDHLLLHDPGHGRCAVPLAGLSRELRSCVCLCAAHLQAEINRVQGTENPVTLAKFMDEAKP